MIRLLLEGGRQESVHGPPALGRQDQETRMATRKKAASPKAKPAKSATSPKGKDTKQQRLIAMLKRPDGATIAQMTKAFGWEPLKKKLGLKIVSRKPEGGERVYRIA
jgi:hypothetical protein